MMMMRIFTAPNTIIYFDFVTCFYIYLIQNYQKVTILGKYHVIDNNKIRRKCDLKFSIVWLIKSPKTLSNSVLLTLPLLIFLIKV